MISLSGVATCVVLLAASIRSGLALPEPVKRTLPAEPTGVKTIKSPNGVEIRYKEPGKDGVCETTPGVNSYSGYVSLNETTNMFFWFFEARHNPATAPITLWLNGESIDEHMGHSNHVVATWRLSSTGLILLCIPVLVSNNS